VSKWFDSGRLRGYRIPGSQDRRIPREHLIRFLKEHGMPLGELEDEAMGKILLVGADNQVRSSLTEMMGADDFKIESAVSGFEAGIQAESLHPDCVVIDFAMGRNEALMIAQNLKKNSEYLETVLIGLLSDDDKRCSTRPSVSRSTVRCSPKGFGRSSDVKSSSPDREFARGFLCWVSWTIPRQTTPRGYLTARKRDCCSPTEGGWVRRVPAAFVDAAERPEGEWTSPVCGGCLNQNL